MRLLKPRTLDVTAMQNEQIGVGGSRKLYQSATSLRLWMKSQHGLTRRPSNALCPSTG
jgi:hypothetical protein